MSMKFCVGCGAEIHESAAICPKCGASQPGAGSGGGEASSTSKVTLAIVCLFFGSLGIHRFMVGKTGTGILMLFTLGFLGIWTLIDFIVILTGKFTDASGKFVSQ